MHNKINYLTAVPTTYVSVTVFHNILGQPDDNMSIEEALDAIIQEEDLSNSTATLEIKETDDEIEISDEDNETAK